MEEKWRLFRLLLWKNYLIRKRHWKVPLFLQILLPVCTFLIMQKIRSLSFDRKNPENVKYYPIDTLTKESLESHNILLHYAPENNFTTALVKKTTQCLSIHPANVTGFPSEEEMLKNHYFDDRVGVYYAILAIIFKDDESSSRKYLDYTVRSSQDTPISLFGGGLQDYYHSFYARYCFLNAVPYVQTQMCIDEAFINISAPNPSISHKVFIQRMPTSRNGGRLHFDEGSRLIFSITAVGVFFVTLCLEASFSASEKYIGVNILMAQNGIKFHMNLCSWLVSGILYSLFYTTVITISITEAFDNPFLFHGNSFIIWLFLIFHTAHLIAFGMHIASYFSNFLTMMIIILILYGGASLFQGYLIDSFIYSIIPYLGIIFPNILLFRMFQEMNLYETLATGVQWSNMFRNADSSYSAAGSIGVMMLFSIIGTALHFFLCVHIYTIFPGKFGIQKHPFYFLQKKAKFYEELDKELEEFNYDNADGTPFEKTPSGIFAPTIQIRNIKKSYKKDLWNKNTQEALNGISIDIHKGQITTVLGHNGSGKTAMMSILAGLSSPTEGVVLIDGKSISDFYTTFSTDLSFCPQENMFFPYLTVIEQMEFFGTIKCLNKSVSQLKMLSFHVEKLLRKLKIYDKRNYFPEELPKNQQRRLCLGLNLITSNAKILLFDEPTSGMDAESKRDTWNMLLEMKCEKTILISTQDTEEADILSDKIAILHLGKLKSYGTPIFLKKLYGQGNIEITFSITSWCDTEIVRKELSEETELLRLEDETMVICVPYTDQLAESLDEIESKKRDLGVTAINVSLVTLEQVFLNSFCKCKKQSLQLFSPRVTKKEEDVDFSRPFVNLAYCSKDYELLLQTIYALFEKNFIRTRRSLSILLPIMLLPLISILLMTLNYSSLSETHESRSLNLGLYNNPQVMLSTTNETLRNKLKNFVDNSSGTTINIDPNLNLQNEASKKDNKLLSDAIHEGENTFLLHELSKYYKSKPIVSDVSFSVKSGECFGLLGVNGAGKSTIFRILTGEELPNKGDMFLGEKDIFTEKREYLSKMGYCPQNTALIDSLNVRDHLRLFAFIRGVPKHQVDSKVEEWINRLNLSECASRPSATYSVGNKRCLSIAMAFIGQPDLVLLDEPTTGVDPASRKSLWNMIKSFLRSGQSVILTSQSMEECEALCNRLAIMSKGRLVCIGPTQKLKERFGHGYNIHIELNLERTQAETEAIKTDIENALNCELGDEHVGYMTFFVTNSETPWKTMYELMNGLKYKYPCIVDFTILSATLEQVFLRFAKADIH
ncbi:ATP-binding cassette sub-family A member 17-like isoform X3 [Belonocnema kinseyi]|uniref:ATP-binding cassette sub-family A member 17-like isoform X3 n=1 Tax=Belonocnema kinseyi TaxID=2817044 RepID=UPI00143DEAEA|nr:ATP-binding cassette sub-family A member 17-like isoform X3 [Belonocnema kinseyi]